VDIDGRHCEAEETQIRNANRFASRRLLAKLREVHGVVEPEPVEFDEPVVVEAEPAPPPLASSWIKMIEELPDPKGPSVKRIKLCVAHHFNLSPRDLESPRRFAKIVLPRQIAFYLARKLTTRSLPDIGRRFGGKDHTTILHACKKMVQRMEVDPKLAETVRCLEEQLQ
jgi:hypothetical protein